MADPRFFTNRGPFTLQELARLTGASLPEGTDAGHKILDVAPLSAATGDQLSFLDNVKYKSDFMATKAGACFVSPDMAQFAPSGTALLVHDNPYKAYALAAQAFYPPPKAEGLISDKAHVDPAATIGSGCRIEAGAVVEAGVELGEGCIIESGAVIKSGVRIGAYSRIGSNAVISHADIGSHTSIYRGSCIGQDGFGFAIDPAGFVKVPQLGRVIIGDHVEIGANTTIDRGAGPDTVIGSGTWIDNLVQIAHNVRIGRGCVIVSQVGISGSTVLEDYVMAGGQAGITGHLKIGKGAKVAAQSGVMRDVEAGEQVMGSPAMPSRQFMRQVAALGKLARK